MNPQHTQTYRSGSIFHIDGRLDKLSHLTHFSQRQWLGDHHNGLWLAGGVFVALCLPPRQGIVAAPPRPGWYREI